VLTVWRVRTVYLTENTVGFLRNPVLFQSAVALKDVPPTNHEREDNNEEMVPAAGSDSAGGCELHYSDGPLAGYSVPPGIGYPISAMNWPQAAHKVYFSYFEREEEDASEDEDRYNY
jgi:hypothetical protein